MTARGAGGDYERLGGRGAHGRQHGELADSHRHFVVLGLVAERAGHAAARGIEGLDVETGYQAQGSLHGAYRVERLLMAMAVDEGGALWQFMHGQSEARGGALAFDELLEQ